jgi:N6-adenosine-specific RNA methylase IME4
VSEPFRVLAADPPWRFKDKLPGKGRGAEKHYPTMTTEEICSLRLPPLAGDSLLFMWRVASMQEDALRVCRAWGFRPVSEIVWCKPRIGMGRYVRCSHETALIATRGRGHTLIEDHAMPSWFEAPRGAHSAKPDRFYEIVEQLVPTGPRVEYFARAERPGWTTVGNALGETIPFGLFARAT